MKEVEIKLKFNDENVFRGKLKSIGKHTETYEIIDCYYGKEGESMKTAENLLRIRTKKEVSELTFKGKRETDSDVWERVEINVSIDNSEKMDIVLKSLGFKIIMKNRTLREYWNVNGTELGIMKIIEPAEVTFVEIEGKTKEEVESVTELFKGVLEPIGKDHFKKLDEVKV